MARPQVTSAKLRYAACARANPATERRATPPLTNAVFTWHGGGRALPAASVQVGRAGRRPHSDLFGFMKASRISCSSPARNSNNTLKSWQRTQFLRLCAIITSDFGGSATGPDARPEGGSVSPEILDRPRNDADGPVPPHSEGLGGPNHRLSGVRRKFRELPARAGPRHGNQPPNTTP